MDVMKLFLQAEIGTQELYEAMLAFILSPHIRSGEFEGNEYIIKKYDQINFFIFPEYEYPDGHREIHGAISIYRGKLLEQINKAAQEKGLRLPPEALDQERWNVHW